MPSLHIKAKTAISPEQFLSALIDFGPGRGTIWGNSQSTYFTLHSIGANEADVTEGSTAFSGVWERLLYDWSKPGIIKLRTIDSNIWATGSGWQYTLEEANDNAGTLITAKVTRYPNSKKGYLILMIVATVGRPFIKRSFKQTLKTIEVQNQGNL